MNHPTCLITGASSGLGAEFASQLAQKGYKTVLVARRKENLEALAEDLERKGSIKPEILVSDLSQESGIQEVENYIRTMNHLNILINNAGFDTPKRFQDVPLDRIMEMINLHVTAPTRLCHAAIPKMDNPPSYIVNVSSLASLIPKPRSSVYSATKSYLTAFSQTLQMDLGESIKVQALCPGYTHTGLHETKDFRSVKKKKIPGFMWMTAREVVQGSIKRLENQRGSSVTYVPGVRNHLLLAVMRNRFVSNLLLKRFYGKD